MARYLSRLALASLTLALPAIVGAMAPTAEAGQVDLSSVVTTRVYLAGRDPHGLTAFAHDVSDPHSPNYRHYLSPVEVAQRFGPTREQTDAVRSWLSGAGLTVTDTNQHYVEARGSVAAAQRAFGVTLHEYSGSGGVHRAPVGDVSVPPAVAGSVLGVTGLDDRPNLAIAQDLGTEPVTVRGTPCSQYYGEKQATDYPPLFGTTGNWLDCGYTPQQIRKTIGLTDLKGSTKLTGLGVKVAVMDAYASPTIVADTTRYTQAHGTEDFRPGQFTQITPPEYTDVDNCGGNTWYSEETLDIQAVHNIAPDADVVYVAAKSCDDQDLLDTMNQIVDNHLADMVSNSWTNSPDTPTQAIRAATEQTLQKAAAEGIGEYFASGDCSNYDPAFTCATAVGSTHKQTSYPTESQWVTAVGGTHVELDRNGNKVFQVSYGSLRSSLKPDKSGWTPDPGTGFPASFNTGGGGGTSVVYTQPGYQANVVPKSLSTTLPDGTASATPMRVIPDVAADGDMMSGMLVGQTVRFPDGTDKYSETRWGGTSLATPLFVGVQALAQQAQHGTPIGFANPQIYARYGTFAFEDVTDTPLGPNTQLGLVRNDPVNSHDPSSALNTRAYTLGHDGELHATPGFDNTTGVGTPSSRYVLSYLS